MAFAQTVISFLLALTILVGVHEFGHFYVARKCGVKVLRFCLGLGKPFWRFHDKHGTEFGIAPFPLGGYVKMLGQDGSDVAPEDAHMSYNNKSVGQRIAILAAGPLANFILAFIIFWGVYAFQGTQSVVPVVSYVEPGSLADQAGVEPGHEIIAIDGELTPTKKDVYESLIMRIGESGALLLTVSEPDSDVRYDSEVELDGWLKDAVDPDVEMGLGVILARPNIFISEVVPEGAAAEAGLQKGDKLVATEGVPVRSYKTWVQQIQTSAGQRLRVTVEREGRELQMEVMPKPETQEDGSVVGKVGVGVYFGPTPQELIRTHHYGFGESLGAAGVKVWDTSKFVLISFKKLLVGEISTKNLSGPIGIAKVAGDYAKAGLAYFIDFLAVLSIYLGILNLLPIPILDGGHILYCIIEGLKGSPISVRVQNMGFSLGLLMLVGVMVIAFYNDIIKL